MTRKIGVDLKNSIDKRIWELVGHGKRCDEIQKTNEHDEMTSDEANRKK